MTKTSVLNVRKFPVTNGTVSGKEDKLSRYKKRFEISHRGFLFHLTLHSNISDGKFGFAEIPKFCQLS